MNDSLSIELNSGSRSILKVGFVLRAGFILIFVLGSALLGTSLLNDSVVGAVVCFAISLVLFLVFFKLLNTAFFREYLVATKEDLTVVRKDLNATKKQVIRLDEIKYFGFSEQRYTKHTMDNPIVDFTGLATQERELQYVIDEGNVKIETGSTVIKFGKNLPSWDVEELVEKVEQFTGKKFLSPVVEMHGDEEADPGGESGVNDELEMFMESAEDSSLTKKHTYKGDFGTLVVEQKNDLPASEDMAYLNGRRAPTGKYQIGEKQFVMVSNGMIYAVRL